MHLGHLMSRKRFEVILKALSYTSHQCPAFRDRFWVVCQILDAWNTNMMEQFTPSWVNCLDESMSTWTNKYSCPGWMFMPRKPWPFGNEYHTVCCSLSSILNRSLLSSGGLMVDVPCLDHSLDSCKGRPDDVQTTKHARRMHAWSRCAQTSLGAHASLFGASGARFWIVTRATSARIEEPSMVSILYIKSSIPDTYK